MGLLCVMRHGEAEFYAASDTARALTDTGALQSEASVSALLQRMQSWQSADSNSASVVNEISKAVECFRLVRSPYKRAVQTANIVQQAFDAAKGVKFQADQMVETELATPESKPQALLEKLTELSEEQPTSHIFLVSHMPLVASLDSLLLEGSVFGRHGFQTSEIALYEWDVLAPGCANLIARLR